MPGITPQLLPFLEAIEFFRGKGIVLSPDSFRDVWAAEHVNAFTVAGVTSMNVLEDIRAGVQTAISDGMSLSEFKKSLIPLLERKGWFSPQGEKAWQVLPDGTLRKRLHPWRLDTIYRTNVQSAYQAGRYAQMIETARDRPYWQYSAVLDGRTRPTHSALDGKVYRFDHPFWNRWYPPNGYNCRCTVRTLSARQLQRRGLVEQIAGTDLQPDPGFDFNPGMERWKPDVNKYSPEAAALLRAQGILPPRDFKELGARLTQIRDALGETGIPAYRGKMAIYEAGFSDLAKSSLETGEIWLRTDTAATIRGVLASGAAETGAEMDALQTLIHELGHHIGYPLEDRVYAKNRSYRLFSQLVNEIWARNHTGTIARGIGIRANPAELMRLIEYRNTEYQPWIERFRELFAAADIPEAEVVQLVDRLNLSERPENYERLLKEFLAAHLDFKLEDDLYRLLTDEEALQDFLRTSPGRGKQ